MWERVPHRGTPLGREACGVGEPPVGFPEGADQVPTGVVPLSKALGDPSAWGLAAAVGDGDPGSSGGGDPVSSGLGAPGG